MSSSELDELSTITYLSYFVKERAPGYNASLAWVRIQMADERIDNFSVRVFIFQINLFIKLFSRSLTASYDISVPMCMCVCVILDGLERRMAFV